MNERGSLMKHFCSRCNQEVEMEEIFGNFGPHIGKYLCTLCGGNPLKNNGILWI
jgi:hypothetical protein